MLDHLGDPASHFDHITLLKPTGGEGGGAETQARGVVRRAGFTRNGVFVGSHVGDIHGILELGAETPASGEVK